MKLSPDEIAARLAEVRRSYLASLQEKRDAIVTQWASLCSHWDNETYQSLYLLVHTLAGSAETFGLVDISREARVLVEGFKRNATQQPPKAQHIATITNDIEKLVASMTSALAKVDQSGS